MFFAIIIMWQLSLISRKSFLELLKQVLFNVSRLALNGEAAARALHNPWRSIYTRNKRTGGILGSAMYDASLAIILPIKT